MPATRERSHAEPRRIPQASRPASPTICPGPAWSRPASCSTRTAASSARCAFAAPISTAPPRPSWSRVTRAAQQRAASASAPAGRCSSRPSACRRTDYPGARFADPASWLVDEERCAAFSADGAHHESRYYLTFLYLPPPEHEGRAERLLYERTRRDRDRGRAARAARLVRDRDRPRARAARRPSCPRPRRSTMPRR